MVSLRIFTIMKTARALLFLSCLLLAMPAGKASSVPDSLRQLYDTYSAQNQVKKQVKILRELGAFYRENKSWDEALDSWKKALKKACDAHLSSDIQSILLDLGQLHNQRQDYPEAIRALKELLTRHLPDDVALRAEAFHQISDAYQHIGNNELAFEYELNALRDFQSLPDSSKTARSLYYIGNIFFYQHRFDSALHYYEQSLEICERIGSDRGVYSCLAAIGGLYSRMNDTPKSLKYSKAAYEKAKAMDYPTGIGYALHNLGVNYLAQDSLDLALETLLEALKIKEGLDDTWGMVSTLRNIGDAYRLKNQPRESLEYLTRALRLSEEIQSKPRILEACQSLADYYKAFGDYEQSTAYLYRALALKDSLVNEGVLEKMGDAQTRFQIQEKEAALLKKEAEIATIYKVGAISGIVVLLLLLWLVYGKYSAQRQYNRTLEHKSRQIQIQNEQLAIANEIQAKNTQKIEAQNRQLEQSNKQLQRFAFIASHDLKEPLRTIGSYANLLKRRYADQLDSDAKEFFDFITQGVGRMYNLLNDVLDYSKVDTPAVATKWVSTESVIEEIKTALKATIESQKARIVVGPLPEIQANPSHIYQLFQNLISNGLKFVKDAPPLIEIGARPVGDCIEFWVKDNGIGLDMAYQDKIFEIFQRLHGKHEYDGTGVGLAICKKIVEQYDGDIRVTSKPGKGCTFFFRLRTEFRFLNEQDSPQNAPKCDRAKANPDAQKVFINAPH